METKIFEYVAYRLKLSVVDAMAYVRYLRRLRVPRRPFPPLVETPPRHAKVPTTTNLPTTFGRVP